MKTMTAEFTPIRENPPGFTELLEQLVASLRQAHEAFRRNDMAEFLRCTSIQQDLCGSRKKLQFPETRKGLSNDCSGMCDPLSTLFAESRRLNQVYAALLGKMRRTIQVKSTLLTADTLTYGRPVGRSREG